MLLIAVPVTVLLRNIRMQLRGLPAGCKWIGVINGATHLNFAGMGFSKSTEKLTLLETTAFLDGVRSEKCAASVPADGITLKSK